MKQAEASSPVMELCREHGMSDARFYKWCSTFGMSIRLASVTFSISDICFRYQARLADENIEIADWLILLTHNQKNRGFGPCYLFLRNVKGYPWNRKRVYRIYRELGKGITLRYIQRVNPRQSVYLERYNPTLVLPVFWRNLLINFLADPDQQTEPK